MSAIQSTNTSNDFSDMLKIDRAEMEGLTAVFKHGRESIPLKITYDNITVHEFYTGMTFRPQHTFNIVKDFAEKEIDAAIETFETKDSSKTVCQDSWQIKNGFVTIDLCLHCYTEYDQSDFVFEDVAIHRVVVSMVAYFKTKEVYSSDSHATKVFREVTDFYAGLKTTLTE
jgi:hypothetical protein